MRLAVFILANREQILAEWEAFALCCTPASGTMDIVALRDHAREMLTVIASDLAMPQSGREQADNDQRRARHADAHVSTAASEHGAGRARSGFTIDQMVAEYRALRASVIRLWTAAKGELAPADLDDLTRFHEALDRSLAESVTRFTHDVEEAKETFLAILGHDLRTPLAAIISSARFMLETGELEEPHLTLAKRIGGSAERSLSMVGALLDFTRSRLGGGIPVVREEVSLGKIVHDVVDEIAAEHPGRAIRVDARDTQHGRWDAARLSQALSNLIGNAVQHGADRSAVTVTVRGDDDRVAIVVHNRGVVIPSDQLDGMFNPMKARRSSRQPSIRGPLGSLGLGLYIAERIIDAHKGHIEVESSDEGGTTFTVHLPRE
jgi:signal transduction histidine kinase